MRPTELRHQCFGVLDVPHPRHHGDDQAVLGLERDVVPVIPLVVVGLARLQCASLATKAHFSSNRTWRVRGGSCDQCVVGRRRVPPGLAAVAGHRVAMDAHEPLGLAGAAPLGDVLRYGDGLLGGQVGTEQRGVLGLGVPVTSGAAAEESARRGFP
jgi:hypothetical protein